MGFLQTPTSADLRQVASGLAHGSVGLVVLVVLVVVVVSSSIIISLFCQIIMLVEVPKELKLKEDSSQLS